MTEREGYSGEHERRPIFKSIEAAGNASQN
jgi:hypothetical protein